MLISKKISSNHSFGILFPEMTFQSIFLHIEDDLSLFGTFLKPFWGKLFMK